VEVEVTVTLTVKSLFDDCYHGLPLDVLALGFLVYPQSVEGIAVLKSLIKISTGGLESSSDIELAVALFILEGECKLFTDLSI
jgi:hypothetical protein